MMRKKETLKFFIYVFKRKELVFLKMMMHFVYFYQLQAIKNINLIAKGGYDFILIDLTKIIKDKR
jgi:hypothetical protein